MKHLQAICLFSLFFSTNVIIAQKVESSTFASGGATTVINGKYYSHVIGQSIWEKMYPEKIDEINLTDFDNVRLGKYVLHIVYKGKPFVASIVKE